MTLQLPPRLVRLTGFGAGTYGFLFMLVSAMLLGPPISFLVRDQHEQILVDRGVLTRFELTGAKQHRDSRRIDYTFMVPVAAGGATVRTSHDSTISNEDFAVFTDPQKCFVLYDPTNPENAIPVTSRSAFAQRHAFDRKVAIWAYPAEAAFILLLSAIGVHRVRRKLRLLRFGVASDEPELTQPKKSKPCVDFRFRDLHGKLREGHQCFNVRIGIGADFAPFMRGAIVFYDPDDPQICELFLPEIATFMFF